MLRWGVLGTASIAERQVLPALRACGHDLAVVGSRSLSRAQSFAARTGVRRARGSYAEVVEADDVDAVYVPLTNDLHERWAVAAAEAGKHVLCEKPLATDAGAAQRMAAAAAAAGVVLMEAVMVRFHPRTEALLEFLKAGEIGAPRLVTAVFGHHLATFGDYRWSRRHGGGALLDLGIYDVALTRWVVGEEPTVAGASSQLADSGVDLTTSAVLTFPSGAKATLHASFDSAEVQWLEVVGTHGRLTLPRAFGAGRDEDAPLLRDGKAIGAWRADPYLRMVTAFADGVASGAAPLPPEDAIGTATVLDAIREAARPVPSPDDQAASQALEDTG